MTGSEMTHDELVARAVRWLRGTQRCSVVVAETVSATWEVPDAIGWRTAHYSILVECKTSRADFFAEAKHKNRRMPMMGMGRLRYYMTPPGLLGVGEIPENWGLLEVHEKYVRVKLKATPRAEDVMRKHARTMEQMQIFSALRILQKEVRDDKEQS